VTFKEFVRFTYGLMMGTSTQFLKPTQRFLFPILRHDFDSHLGLFLGGSGICGVLEGQGEVLVINTNQGAAATDFRRWVDERAGRGAETVILSSAAADFSRGLVLFADARRIFVGPGSSKTLRAELGDLAGRAEVISSETVIEVAGERVRMIPVAPAATESDLVVYLEGRAVVFLGPLFYNRVHPILRPGNSLKPDEWIKTLEEMLERFSQAKVFVPAEGDVGSREDVVEFIGYLKDLRNPAIEFAKCREKYDWPEIPSYTSLEENFDFLREKQRSHTTLN
jgi:glyoxylase-like metal-dependent hydrolase (beta-lactamase superfamily II)